MLRLFDFFLSLAGLLVLIPLLFILYCVVFWETGSPFFFQSRMGRHKKVFTLVKFRTMHPGTQSAPSHLIDPNAVTTVGRLLRRWKLDELPQLWNVLLGDMSLVGPRPCLISQHELIDERDRLGVFKFRPGVTGLAQVMNIDMSTPALLARTDAQMLADMNIRTYLRIIAFTLLGRGLGDRVSGGGMG